VSHFIIFDLEFTTWEGAFQRGWDGENEFREIVQIGALKVEYDTLKVLGELNLLIKPARNPQLSQFFQDLTHVTQERVDREGMAFVEAFDRFAEFCDKALVFSYGNDMVVLGENIGLHGCPRNVFGKHDAMEFVNISPYFNRIDPVTIDVNSGRLWQHFNLPKPGEADEHDALFDCYSILAAIRHLLANGQQLPL